MSELDIVWAVLVAVGVSLFWALMGIAKSFNKTDWEGLQKWKLVKTGIIAVIIGVIMGVNGWTYEFAEAQYYQWSATFLFVVVIDMLSKWIWRWIARKYGLKIWANAVEKSFHR